MTYDPQRQELYTVKATPDPEGSGQMGVASTINLQRTALAHVLVQLAKPEGEVAVLEVDIYAAQVEGGLEVNLFCPRCRNHLRVTSDRKAIQFEPGEPEFDPSRRRMIVRGKLSIEPFMCTWEEDPSAQGIRNQWGGRLCRWSVGIDNNLARST